MTSAIDRIAHRPATPAIPDEPERGDTLPANVMPSALIQWATEARQAGLIAQSLAQTPFVPQSLRGANPQATAANVTGAILTGHELGLEPMASLRSIDIIQGTPAMRAVALRALVQGAGHAVWVVESSDTRAVVRGHRAGDPAHEQESVWTIERARGLGLTGKDNWKKQPGAMLVARASSELCRMVASDVILGVPYSAEELRDSESTTPVPTTATARRITAQDIVSPQQAEPEPPTEDAPAATLGDGNRRKLHATLGDLGITDRAERLALLGQIADRKLGSSNELTTDELDTVFTTLATFAGDGERLRTAFDMDPTP